MKILSHMQYLVVLISILLLSSCGGGKKVAPTVIPADASMVVAFDLKNLTSDAVELKDIFSKDFLKSLTSDEKSSDAVSQIMNSGVDLKKPAYFFAKFDKSEENMYFGMSFKISDAKKFGEGINKLEKKPEIKSEGDYKFGIKDGVAIVWSEKSNEGLIYGMPDAKDDAVKTGFMAVLKTEPSNSLDNKNKEFKAMLTSRYDVGMWMNYQDLQKMNGDLAEMSGLPDNLQALSKLAKFVTAQLNFEKGELKIDTKSYVDEELLAKYKDLIKDKVDNEPLLNTGIEEPTAFFAFGVGMKGVKQLLKESNMLNGTEQMKEMLGISIDEMFDMFTGDMALSLGKMNLESMRNPEVEVSMAMGIANKDTYKKLMAKLEMPMFGLKSKDGFYQRELPGTPYDLYVLEKNGVLVLTNNEKVKDNVKAGKKIKSEYGKMMSGNIGVTYVNMGEMMKAIPKNFYERDKSMKFFMDNYAKEFKSIEASSSTYKRGVSEGSLTLKMNNSRNTLAFLVEMFRKMAKEDKVPA